MTDISIITTGMGTAMTTIMATTIIIIITMIMV